MRTDFTGRGVAGRQGIEAERAPGAALERKEGQEQGKVIARFDKNPFEHVRLTLQPWQGKRFLEFRIYRNPEESTGKGFALRLRLLPALQQALEKAMAILKAEIDDDERRR